MGRANLAPVPGADSASVLTPDDIMAGKRPVGPVIIYDDDHYYMGNVIAELLRGEGHDVTLATPALCIAQWTQYTLEQEKIERRMVDLGIEILARHRLSAVGDGTVEMVESLTGATVTRPGSVVSVTARLPRDALYYALSGDAQALARCRHPVGQARWRLLRPGDHRRRGLRRPPLRPRTRYRGRPGLGAVPPRALRP